MAGLSPLAVTAKYLFYYEIAIAVNPLYPS